MEIDVFIDGTVSMNKCIWKGKRISEPVGELSGVYCRCFALKGKISIDINSMFPNAENDYVVRIGLDIGFLPSWY